MGEIFPGWTLMIVRKSILGTEISYIPQAAMNALNPTRKIINFIEDVYQAHDQYKTKQEIYELASDCFEHLRASSGGTAKIPG